MKSSQNIKTFIVKKEEEQLRLDQFLRRKKEIRSQASKLLNQKKVFLNNKALKASYRIKAGELLSVQLEESQSSPYKADILFEDESLIVVNKASGVLTHPAPGNNNSNLVQALLDKNKSLSPGSHPLRPGIVHRLDKDSSGLLLVAKKLAAQEFLIKAFKNREIKREYFALSLKPPQPLEGRLETWLIRHPKHRQKFYSIKEFKAGAKKAITNYKLIKEHESGLSWIKCQLETGRTHQIRVHLSSINCPILGDPLYGRQKLSALKDSGLKQIIKNLNRVALHAFRLEFQHPVSKKTRTFEIGWPDNLKALLERLQFE